ncbi:MAG: hypothetical protein ACJAW7_003478 [Candidatus Azotimanducaceae bacterium]|jgi:hypothetical protein
MFVAISLLSRTFQHQSHRQFHPHFLHQGHQQGHQNGHEKRTSSHQTFALRVLNKRSRILAYCCVLVSSLFLSACSSNPSGVGTRVKLCCPTATYQSFIVTTQDMPAFLGPIMTSNFSVALASHGLTPIAPSVDLLSPDKPTSDTSISTDSVPADLTVELSYEQENLSPDSERDNFAEHLAAGDAQRFVAKIMIEIRDNSKSELVWAGQIQRIHDVGPGEYMHTGKASTPLLDAFTQVLEDFQ